MKRMLSAFTIAALAALPVDFALAASGDTPVSPSGATGRVSEARSGPVTPSFGTGSTDADELRDRGASVVAPTESFPSSGLGTVAYGKVGARGMESIINWDARTRSYANLYPNRAIVFIEINGAHLCTGWMYSPSMVATAGHCVHTGGPSGTWRNRSQMRVYPGRDGTSSPYGSCTVSRLHSVIGWTQNGDFKFDYGAMRLNCTVGNTVGWFGMYDNTAPVSHSAIIHGYPGDKPRTQWTGADKIRSASTEMLSYRIDTVGGNSGSPVWHDRTDGTAMDGAWAIGIHNYGVGAFGSNANSAARLTQVRINNYINWRNAP